MRLFGLFLGLVVVGIGAAPAAQTRGSAPDMARSHFERSNCHGAYDVLVEDFQAGRAVSVADRAWGKTHEGNAHAKQPCPTPSEDLLRRATNRTVVTEPALSLLANYQDQDDAAAYFEMALAIINGKFPKYDPQIGFKALGNAVRLGNPAAQYYLGLLHVGGAFGKPSDYASGLPLIEKAAQAGHVDAMFMTANFYKDGLATKKDAKKAFDYYRQAAERGHIFATYLGYHMVMDGEGTQRNHDVAYRLARNMADQGEVYGAVMAAATLLQRKDAVKHEDEVLFWLDVAARDGDQKIKAEIGKLRPLAVAAYKKAKAPPEYVPRVRKVCPMKTVCYVSAYTGARQSCTTNKDYWNDCDL